MFVTFLSAFFGAFTSLALFLIHRYQNWGMFSGVMVVWFIVVLAFQYFVLRVRPHKESIYPITITSMVALVGLLSVIEEIELRYLIILVGGLIQGFLHASLLTQRETMTYTYKPFRRFIMMMWVFDAYALSTTFFALVALLPSTLLFFIMNVLTGLMFGGISLMIWRLYFHVEIKKFVLWMLLMVFIAIELTWIVHLLPFGYLASGFLVTWVWYVIQLLTRFHFSEKNIVWKDQISFLVTNAILYGLILFFFIRWV